MCVSLDLMSWEFIDCMKNLIFTIYDLNNVRLHCISSILLILNFGLCCCRLDFQKYCDAMKKLSLTIMEILGVSLGVDRQYYKDFFEDGSSILRCNFYPPCQEPGSAIPLLSPFFTKIKSEVLRS